MNTYFRFQKNKANNTERLLEAIGEQKIHEKIVTVKRKDRLSRIMAVV